MTFAQSFIEESIDILNDIDCDSIERMATGLAGVRDRGGRLFVLGVGGSAGHAGHAVNDFRKLCGFEAYAPTDNVSELTARTNDDGWDTVFSAWLFGSRLRSDDALLIFSVGGGSRERNVSANLVSAVEAAQTVGAEIYGIVGRDGGYTAKAATEAVVIPPKFESRITPHTEGLAAVVWHLLVSHPSLQTVGTNGSRCRDAGDAMTGTDAGSGRRAVFLDRDGVLNEALTRDGRPFSPRSLEEFQLLPGVVESCQRLAHAGWELVVVTNQPEIARGTLDPEVLESMHDQLRTELGPLHIRVCRHDDADSCRCRKPKPGLVFDAAEELGIDLERSFLVGDRWRDVECAHNAGVSAIFIDNGWAEDRPKEPFHEVGTLREAVDVILAARANRS